MTEKLPLDHPDYDPAAWLDWLAADVFKVTNDAALARKIGIDPSKVSQVRNKKIRPPHLMMVIVQEASGLHVRDLRARMYRKTAV